MAKQNEYNKVIDALNLIDESAERGGDESYEDQVERGKAYEIVANFIDKHASRKYGNTKISKTTRGKGQKKKANA